MKRIRDKDLPLVWQLAWKMAALCLLVLAGGFLWIGIRDKGLTFASILPWILGTLLGAAFNVLRLIMMSRSVKKAAYMLPSEAESFTRWQYVLRYFLCAGILVLAAVLDIFNPFATLLSLATLQIATYIQGWLDPKYYPTDPDKLVPVPEEEEEEHDRYEEFVAGMSRSGRRSAERIENEMRHPAGIDIPANPQENNESTSEKTENNGDFAQISLADWDSAAPDRFTTEQGKEVTEPRDS